MKNFKKFLAGLSVTALIFSSSFFMPEIVLAEEDAIPPQIISASTEKSIYNRSDIGATLSVTVQFNEPVDTGFDPDLWFESDITPALDMGSVNAYWESATVFKYEAAIIDNDIDFSNVDVLIRGVYDLTGNQILEDGVQNRAIAVFTLDLKAPVVNFGNLSAFGATGDNDYFKRGDRAIFRWNNSSEDGDNSGGDNDDVTSVIFSSVDFHSGDTSLIAGVDGGNYWSATSSFLDDDKDSSSAIFLVSVYDDAGNITTTSSGGYKVDTIVPVFSEEDPLVALRQDGSATSYSTDMWYYFSNSRFKIKANHEEELDGETMASLKMCIKTIYNNDPNWPLCDESDFENNDNYISGGVNQDGTSIEINNDVLLPDFTGIYPANFQLVDHAGNKTISSVYFYVIPWINPKDIVSELNNENTTDWSTINDFTDVPSGLVLSAESGGQEFGRITFLNPLNLTETTTVAALIDFSNNISINNNRIKINSLNAPRLNAPAEIKMVLSTSSRPGIIVKDDLGDSVGYLPFDQNTDYEAGNGDILSNINWDAEANTFSFNTSGFSEFNADNSAPTVTLNSPARNARVVGLTNEIKILASDDSGENINCSIYNNGILLGSFEAVSGAEKSASYLFKEGINNWYAVCTDRVGNTATSSTSFFTARQPGGVNHVPGVCNEVIYDEWQNDCVNGWQYRNIKSFIPAGCRLSKIQEDGRARKCGKKEENNSDQGREDDQGKDRPSKEKVLGVKIYSEGVLVRDRKNKKIYIVENGKLKHVLNLKELQKYHGRRMIEVDGI